MTDNDALHERGRALEDEFFYRVDEQLRAKLRESMQREEAKAQLKQATGFSDEALLDHLLDEGFEATRIAALALVPAIFVAWADGSVTPQERQVILSAALSHGIDQEASALKLVEAWLEKRPPEKLWNQWKEYAVGIQASLTPMLATAASNEIQHQAKLVAEASRQKFQITRVSSAEQKVLDDIAAVLN